MWSCIYDASTESLLLHPIETNHGFTRILYNDILVFKNSSCCRCCRNLSIRFGSIQKTIRYKSTSEVIKFNWPSINWPISKRLSTRMTDILENPIWHSIFWNYYFFTITVQGFCSHFLPDRIELNRIENRKSHSIRFDLCKNIQFNNEIRFDFDSTWQPCYISLQKWYMGVQSDAFLNPVIL
jgi:hypothetical protein